MFVDRKPTRPMRYKVKPESGGEPYYVTMERADEPTVEGTPLNAAVLNRLLEKPANAKVGQYLKVVSVDSAGYVSEVETAEAVGGGGVTSTTLWEGSVGVTSNSSVSSLGGTFDAEAYDYYDVTVEYEGYYLSKTAVRCYTCSGSAISGHLCWYAGYWLSLDVMIHDNGSVRLGCLYRAHDSTSYTLGSNTFTVTKIVGYKIGA